MCDAGLMAHSENEKVMQTQVYSPLPLPHSPVHRTCTCAVDSQERLLPNPGQQTIGEMCGRKDLQEEILEQVSSVWHEIQQIRRLQGCRLMKH